MNSRIENGVTIITIPQKLDVLTSPEVEAELLRLVAENETTHLACDFSNVKYVSSAGLRVMLLISKKIKAVNGSFYLFGLEPQVYEPFRIVGFDKIMDIQKAIDS